MCSLDPSIPPDASRERPDGNRPKPVSDVAREATASSQPGSDATHLLHRMAEGDAAAAAELLPLVYEQLHRIAASHMRGERADHTLQPTAIVHEAYLRLAQGRSIRWESRAHFLAVAAEAIRRVLIDHARRSGASKRGGDRRRVVLEDRADLRGERRTFDVELLDLNDALERLANMNPRQSRIVELRFFGGMTNEEVSRVLGISRATISEDWAFARAWLAKELDCGAEL